MKTNVLWPVFDNFASFLQHPDEFGFNWIYDQNARLTELVELSTLMNFANINKLSKRSQKRCQEFTKNFVEWQQYSDFHSGFMSLFYHCSLRTVGNADKLTPSSGTSSNTGTL